MNITPEDYDIEINPDGSGSFRPKVRAGLWVPKIDETYWLVDACFYEGTTTNDGANIDQARIAYGNCYPTEQLAQRAANEAKRASIIAHACIMADPGFVADWNDHTQKKFRAYFDHRTKDWSAMLEIFRCQEGTPHTSETGIAKALETLRAVMPKGVVV